MYQILSNTAIRRSIMTTALLFLAGAAPDGVLAGSTAIGGANGGFESGFTGMVTSGDARQVTRLGILTPTEGSKAALLTTEPDAGSTPADASAASVRINSFTIPAGTGTLRLDYNFLTDEPTPSFTNDRFTVQLFLVSAGGKEEILDADTFLSFFPAPWTGYEQMTGFRTMAADVSAHAGTGEVVSLELRIADLGDGRANSAVFLDNLQFSPVGEPFADAGGPYLEVGAGDIIRFDGLGSADPGGGIIEYRWDFGGGTYGIGPVVDYGFPSDGVRQVTLTVTDAEGRKSTQAMTVVVGDLNHAPAITSTANITAVEGLPYKYQAQAIDPETVYGDTLTYSLVSGPAGMSMNASSGLLAWTPPVGGPKRSDVTIRVTDSMGLFAEQSFSISIDAEVYVVATDDEGRLFSARSNGDGTFEPLTFIDDLNYYTRGAAIADFDNDGDFDLISGHGNDNPRVHLYYYEKQGTRFLPPVYLGPVGSSTISAGSWLMDMAAGDVNNDGEMDFTVNGDGNYTWLFTNRGKLEFREENLYKWDFETPGGFDYTQCSTSQTIVNTTAASGTSSMEVRATANGSCLSTYINRSDWYYTSGPTMTFSYRIPAGVPVGLFFHVEGRGWISLGGSPAANRGGYPIVPSPVALVDDDTWRTVSIDIFRLIRAYWPDATRITYFEWFTNYNTTLGQKFWYDDFKVTRRAYVSGFDVELLAPAGGNGRGMDMADVNRDGNIDIVRARYYDGFIHLYTGTGTGAFSLSASAVADPGGDPYGVVAADFNSDGKTDILAVEGGSGDPYLFRGNGNGTFQAGTYVPSLDTANHAAYGVYDFNHDGKEDLVVTDYSGRNVFFYPGKGDGTFGSRKLIGNTTGYSLGVAAPAGRGVGQPFVNVVQDKTEALENETVSFDASASYDDGSVASFVWNFGDGTTVSGPAGTHAIISHSYAVEGDYKIILTVYDNEGKASRKSLRVRVYGDPPVAVPGGPYMADESSAQHGRWTVIMDGSASHDDHTSPITRYEWDFDAANGVGVDATGPVVRPVYTAPGVYTVTLTVYDSVGQPSAPATTTVTITANGKPTALLLGPATLDETAAVLGSFAGRYDLSGSTDDQGIATYTLNWGDGSPDTVLRSRLDDFEDNEFSSPAWTASSGSWSVTNGMLNQTDPGPDRTFLYGGDPGVEDYSFESDVVLVSGTGQEAILRFRVHDTSNFYEFILRGRGFNDVLLYRYVNGSATSLRQVVLPFAPAWNTTYRLKVECMGPLIRLFVNGALILEQNDPTFHRGAVGFATYRTAARFDNVLVQPIGDSLMPVHLFPAAGSYKVTLTVTDHAGQSTPDDITTNVAANDPPMADAGGPYFLTENEAWDGKWDLNLNLSASTDDHGIEKYTIDFGDGTSMTTGVGDGSRTGFFMTGTDLYGYGVPNSRLARVLATEDNTLVEIVNLATLDVIASATMNRFQTWNDFNPGDGVFFKVRASKPVNAYFTNLGHHAAFMPSSNGTPVGNEFVFYRFGGGGFFIYAFEDTLVRFFNTSGGLVAENSMRAGTYWAPPSLGDPVYRTTASGRIAMQTYGGNGYTTVPADTGSAVGRLFYYATYGGQTGSFAVFAQEDAGIEVFDLDSGALLYTRTMAAGEMWYQNGLGTRRLRLASTGDVEVWAGDNEGGTGILDLGDDISMTTGRDGTDFLLHNLRDGIVLFAPTGATITVDGSLVLTLEPDRARLLAPTDFPAGSGIHRVLSDRPIVIQTLGRANTFNDLGTYLGGVSAHHRYGAVGDYVLTVTVTDRAGQTNSAQTTVQVRQGAPPVPVITAPAVVDEDAAAAGRWKVQFDAKNSTDDSRIIRYEWDFGNGSTGTGVSPVHYYSAPGTYTVKLTVTDRAAQKTSTTFDVLVKLSAPPVADAGGPYTFGEEAASYGVWTATLDGSGSTDDYDIHDYLWTFGPVDIEEDFNGTVLDSTQWAAAGVTVNQQATVTGISGWGSRYLFNKGSFARAGQVFYAVVTPPASGTHHAMWGFKNTSANYSYDQMPHCFYLDNGYLRIYENASNIGNIGSYTLGVPYEIRITLKAAGAVYEWKRLEDARWTTVFESSSTATTPLTAGGVVHTGAFLVDDIRVATAVEKGPAISRTYTTTGVYPVTLRVRDQALQPDYDATTVTIADGAPPVAKPGGPYKVEKGSLMLFNGSASTDDTGIETYHWTFGDTTGGPGDANLPFEAKGAAPEHFFRNEGTYTATLTVTDHTLKSDTATTTVEVVTGAPPVADAGGPYLAGMNGPPAYFDARASADDYGIVEYRWDMDANVDRNGDGNFTNDIDAVGATPYYTYTSVTEPLTADFSGTVIDSAVWLTANATQNEKLTVNTASYSWGSGRAFTSAIFERAGLVAEGQIRPVGTGYQHVMWGLHNGSADYNHPAMRHAIYFAEGNLYIYEDGSNRGHVGTYTKGALYDVRIVAKAAGADYFIRSAGAASWTQLISYSSLNSTASPLKVGMTAYYGTFDMDNISVTGPAPKVVTLTVEDGAGQTATVQTTVQVAVNLAPNVITVPWVAHDPIAPHETYNGKSIRLKGIVRDADPASFQWDFGDGTSSAVTAVTNPYDLSAAHTYPNAPTGTPFVATLKVWDKAGNLGQDTYNVVVKGKSLNTEINIAIDEGLWYLHQTQTRSSSNGYPTGYWTSNAYPSATASATQAFEINGHLETTLHNEDPYAETVQRGLAYVFTVVGPVTIGAQTYGHPDTNGNGIGIQVASHPSPYQLGQVMDAIASSGNILGRSLTGPANVARRFYFDILTDMVDLYAWGQYDDATAGGGWRYDWNTHPDNSAAQWGAIGLLAAEDIFNIPVPPFVKERNNVWLNYSYNGTGFGYTGGGNGEATTPSGLVQLAFDDKTRDDKRWKTAEDWIAANWTGVYRAGGTNKNYYAYYALTKAMRLANPKPVVTFSSTGFDWFSDPDTGLARTIIDDQMSSGRFQGGNWVTDQLTTAWGVIILSRSLFVQPPVADAGRDRVWGVDLPITLDGSASFHLDPFRSLVKYEWDVDGDGVYDYVGASPTLTHTYTRAKYPESTLPRTITASLRVTDNNVPPLTDVDQVNIVLAVPPHPPVADAGGPYTCTAGIPCQLDGGGSFDIDPTDFIARYEWELDGVFPYDFADASGETPAHIFPNAGVFNIGLRVWDNGVMNDLNGDGQLDENERLSDQQFTRANVVQNLAPKADAGGPYTVDEGSIVTLDGGNSSDPNNDPLTYFWDLDNDGQYDDATGVSANFTGVDDGTYTVGLQVSDSLLLGTDTATVTVRNVAPGVNAGPDRGGVEGSPVAFSGSFTDPGVADTHTVTWDFGDGSAPVTGTLTPNHVYAENGAYTVTLSVSDDDGGVGADTLVVTVANAPPAVNAGPDASTVEGDTIGFTGSFTDAGVLDTHTISWNFGDGSAPAAGTLTLSHTYAENGTYTVTLTVTDDDGGTGTDTLKVTVVNAPPAVNAGPDQTVAEGAAASFSGSFTDAGVQDTHTVSWNFGDGSAPAAGSLTPTHVYAENGSYTVTLTVTDDDGGTGTDTLIVTVTNLPPVVDAGPNASAEAGQVIALAPATFTDAGRLDTHTATVDWGDGTVVAGVVVEANGSGTVAASHAYAGTGTYTVTVTVTDDEGAQGSDTLSAVIYAGNAPPAVDAGPDTSIDEGGSFVRIGSFADPDPDTWTGTVDYGDGSGVQPLALAPDKTFSLAHLYPENGVFTVTVTVTDSDGATGTDKVLVTVRNLAPAVDAGPDATINQGGTFSGSGSFSDPGADLWSATVDYGDGTGVQPLVLKPDKTFDLSHVYGTAGSFTVRVSVSDDDGGAGADTLSVTVTPPISPVCGDLDHDLDVDVRDKNLLFAALRVCSGQPGYLAEADYDGDGCITFNDYREWYKCYLDYASVLAKSFGSTAGNPGDLDGDGDVDGMDLAIWLQVR